MDATLPKAGRSVSGQYEEAGFVCFWAPVLVVRCTLSPACIGRSTGMVKWLSSPKHELLKAS
jgi:hypothetical protein